MSLIDNAGEIKKHNSAITAGIEMVNVQSFIDDAINIHIIPALGRTTFEGLVSAKSALTDEQKPVFDLIQKAAVGFMLAYYAGSGAVTIDNSGISVVKKTNGAPASDKKLLQLRRDSFDKGYGSLELAVNYLEENIQSFPAYASSSEHSKNRALMLNTSAEFQRAGVNIGNSAQLYQTLRTYQYGAERDYIENLLGEDLTEDIRAVILNGSASPIQLDLINRLGRAIAYLTMMEAIPYLAISITPDGIFQLSESVGGMAANVETKTSASDKRLQSAMFGMQAKGEAELEKLRKWLANKADQFPGYTVPESIEINNDPDSNIYYL